MKTPVGPRQDGSTPPRRDPAAHRRAALAVRGGLESLEGRQLLSTFTWTGQGDKVHWGDAANWQNGAAPGASGGQVVFPASASGWATTVNADAPTAVPVDLGATPVGGNVDLTLAGTGTLQVHGSGAGYRSIAVANPTGQSGGTLEVTGPTALPGGVRLDPGTTLAVDAGQAATIGTLIGGGAISVGSGATLAVGTDGSSTAFAGTVGGPGTLQKTGGGTLKLTSSIAPTTPATVDVAAGTLAVDATTPAGTTGPFNVAVETGSTLTGFRGVASLTVAPGGMVSPGSGGAGTMTLSGAATFSPGSNLIIQVAGPAAGTGYDQLVASGPVDLGGSTLTLNSTDTSADVGDRLDIVHAASIQHAFTNLPDGGTILSDGAVYRASYTAQDVILTRVQAVTSTTLASSASAGQGGDALTLTATVAGASRNTDGLQVNFFDNGQRIGNVAMAGGRAAMTYRPGVGTHGFTAGFVGDLDNAASASSPVSLIATRAAVTVSSPTSSANPAPAGWPVTLGATVTPPAGTGLSAPTGAITFYDGSTAIGSAPIDAQGVAHLTTPALSAGLHAITASYPGDSQYQPGGSRATAQGIGPVGVGLTLTSAPAPATGGRSIALTAMAYTPVGSPTGLVTFKAGDVTLGTAPIDVTGKATLTTTALTPGTHALTASYNGDATHQAATSAAVSESVALVPSAVALVAPTIPPAAGQPMSLKATVAAAPGAVGSQATATGVVTFSEGGTTLGTANLDATGTASLVLSTLAPGTHAITASYAGDPTFAASSAMPAAVAVAKATATARLAAVPATPLLGQPVSLEATVTASMSNPGGTVTFFDGTTSLGTATLAAGRAILVTSLPAGATHSITASYGGDATDLAATSPAISVVPSTTQVDTGLAVAPTVPTPPTTVSIPVAPVIVSAPVATSSKVTTPYNYTPPAQTSPTLLTPAAYRAEVIAEIRYLTRAARAAHPAHPVHRRGHR